jgi:hypothetical protein
MMDKCSKCGRDAPIDCIERGDGWYKDCLRRQLAAANERASTYLGEMVVLQEALDSATVRAGSMEKVLQKIVDLGVHAEPWRDVAYMSRIAREALEVRDE